MTTRKSRSGHVMMEGAFILVPLLAVFLALLDFGMAIFLKNTMQFAVRQGVRYAVTSQVMQGLGQDDSIRSVVNQYSMGFLNYLAQGGPNTTCSGTGCITINYYSPTTLAPLAGPGSNAGGNVVEVTASGLSWAWIAPLLRDATPLQFSVSSADVMEASPNGIPPNR